MSNSSTQKIFSFMAGIVSVMILLCLPLSSTAQPTINDQMSKAELYRQITQLEQIGEYSTAAEAYRLIAEKDLAEIDNLDKAIKNYIEAQKLFEKAGDSVRMYQTINDLGHLYSGSEYYLEAIAMFEKVKSYASRTLDTLTQARMLQQIGEIYIARKQVSEASRYLEQASKLNLQIQDTLLSVINQLTITALTGHRKMFSDLPDSMRLELSKYDSIRYESFLPSIHLHVGMYNMRAKKYKLAEYYFHQGLKLSGHDTFVKRELYRYLSECYEKMNDYPAALSVMKTYNNFNDSLNDASKSSSIQQMLLNSKNIERETELQEMALDRNITALKSRISKVFSVGLLVAVVFMLIVSYIFIRSFQQRLNANQIITKQNEELTQRKINELETNLKIETMSSMLTGQEVERERIARDLHDSLGGLLSTVKLHFDAIQVKNPEITSQKEYSKAYTLLDAACAEVRTISNNMQPGALLKMGIVPAIKDLINRIESEEMPHIEFIHYGPLHNLPTSIILHIFRIVQELLYNCIKHAHAKEILIQLIRNEEDLEIMVEDDGQGYDPAEIKKGMGTENVSARVNFLKGEISVYSVIGTGTTSTITIPYTQEMAEGEVFSNFDPEMF
ncbi:MAG: ATP-binding protein [Saprospiraceae bacterium]|uniref:histidine kinase n=1 Tax=Candidatus Opimibacter skivensis TaxID=2982028 RepID=A0A9D7SYH2_9BACT|nr:ATP-binding protein [Candidatus Opimibacter skivensis]